MKCAIMQPTYLPWAGCFNLMASADVFVFYDDAQFSKGSWHNRNRVLCGGEVHWITVPVRHSSGQRIRDVEIDDRATWQRKHINKLRACYGRSAYYADLDSVLHLIKGFEGMQLCELTISLIESIAQCLQISTRCTRSSELEVSGGRTTRLVNLCRVLGCEEYLSPAGGREYIEQDGDFAGSDINVSFQNYQPGRYPQRGSGSDFVSHLSIVDVLASIGAERAREYIGAGKFDAQGLVAQVAK